MLLTDLFPNTERAKDFAEEVIAGEFACQAMFEVFLAYRQVLALREKRSDLGGLMSWKEGFTFGVRMTIAVAILSPVAQLIIHSLISPDFYLIWLIMP